MTVPAGSALCEALGDAALQRVDFRAAAATGQSPSEKENCHEAHVQPPMNGSASKTVSKNAFMISMKNAPASGTMR